MSGGPAVFVLATLLLAVPAAVVPGLLRARGAPAYALGALLVAAAEIVLLATALSVPGDHFTAGGMLAGELVAAAAALVAARRLAWRPSRPSLPSRASVIAAARSGGVVTAFACLMGVVIAVQLFQALAVVSNGWDPNNYHLSRAAYWVQYHSITQFTGGTQRQLAYPPDAEILLAWTMLMAHADYAANLVQWLCWLGTGVGIFMIARFLGFRRSGSLLAGLLFMAMPIPVMEATTAQNEDVVACFVIATLAFGLRGLRDRHRGELALAAIALGLAVGTKLTVAFAAPAVVIALLAVVVRHRPPARLLLQAGAMAVVAVLALGTYNYVENARNTGTLLGHPDSVKRVASFYQNSVMTDWGYADLPGISIPGFDMLAQRWMPDIVGKSAYLSGFTYKLDSGVDDSTSAFGPVAPLILLPVLLAFALGRRSGLDRRALAIGALVFALLFPLAEQDHPDFLRIAAPGIALGAPLLAALVRWRGLTGVAVAVAVLGLVPSVLTNHAKPIVVAAGDKPAYAKPRLGQIAYGWAEVAQAVGTLDARLGPKAPIGYVGPNDGWDYPYFGSHLQRRVVRMLDTSKISIAEMRRQGLAGVVVDRLGTPAGLQTVVLSPTTKLVLPAAKS